MYYANKESDDVIKKLNTESKISPEILEQCSPNLAPEMYITKQWKAPWAAHGWLAQSQVYFLPSGKTSLCAKPLVWKYMSPVYSFA